MKVQAMVCSLTFLSFLAVAVRGQESATKIDLSAAYSYVRANPSVSPTLPSFNMNGGEASVAYNVNSWLGGVFDFAGYRTSRLITMEGVDFKGNMWTYLFGPRFSYRHLGRFTPYAQTLFGVAHATSDTYLEGNQTDFAMTVGGGLDFRLSRRFSLRPLQADYLLTHFREADEFKFPSSRGTQNNVRLSAGLVFHF